MVLIITGSDLLFPKYIHFTIDHSKLFKIALPNQPNPEFFLLIPYLIFDFELLD